MSNWVPDVNTYSWLPNKSSNFPTASCSTEHKGIITGSVNYICKNCKQEKGPDDILIVF